MIRYLTYDEIDREKWDECIAHSCNGIIYAYSWYLDIVCEHWEALVEDDYKSVFPLTVGSKYGINYLYQPYFIQQLGIFSKNELTEEITDKFLQAIPAKYRFVEINLNTFNKVNQEKYNTISNLTHELELNNSYEAIYKNYSTNTKRNIKKAQEKKVSIVKSVRPEDIINIFKSTRGKDISTFKEKDYFILTRLIYTCIHKGMAHVFGAYTDKNELCAGAFFVESNRKAIFLFSATNEEAKSNGAMSLLIDSFIKENSQRNIILDFEGSNDENLARFYKSFGSKELIYLHVKKNELPWYIKKGVDLIKMLRRN